MKKIFPLSLTILLFAGIMTSCKPTPRTSPEMQKEMERLEQAAELKKAAELAKNAELKKTAALAKNAELAKAAELKKAAELAKNAELTKAAELKKAAELAKNAELTKAAELKKAAALAKNAELAKAAELKKAAALAKVDSIEYSKSLVRVASSTQAYMPLQPWLKEKPKSAKAMGVYLGNGLVLCPGKVVRNASYIEMSMPDLSMRTAAELVYYDKAYNLALIKIKGQADIKDSLLDTRVALSIGKALKVGETAKIWYLLRDEIAQHSELSVKNGESSNYTSLPALALQAKHSLEISIEQGLPIIKDGKLVALSTSYSNDSQSVNAINAELISRFIKASETKTKGIPFLGIGIEQLIDPVFRRYLKIPHNNRGVYLSKVIPVGSAAKAGLKEGDVILSIDGIELDNKGRLEHPLYGRIDFHDFIAGYRPLGEELLFEISRKGKKISLSVPLNEDARKHALIKTQTEKAPRYIIYGGLLFQVVTKDYLHGLSRVSRGRLPLEILQIRNENKHAGFLKKGYKELSTIGIILPTSASLGYESIRFCHVEKVNDKIVSDFNELARLLDEPTADGLVKISINKPPFTIYLDRQEAARSNDGIRRRGIPRLRQL